MSFTDINKVWSLLPKTENVKFIPRLWNTKKEKKKKKKENYKTKAQAENIASNKQYQST